MLQFNPFFRPTATELLKNEIFNDIRIEENEISAEHQIVTSVDQSNYCAGHYSDKEQNNENH